jgi:hypothetical protein
MSRAIWVTSTDRLHSSPVVGGSRVRTQLRPPKCPWSCFRIHRTSCNSAAEKVVAQPTHKMDTAPTVASRPINPLR